MSFEGVFYHPQGRARATGSTERIANFRTPFATPLPLHWDTAVFPALSDPSSVRSCQASGKLYGGNYEHKQTSKNFPLARICARTVCATFDCSLGFHFICIIWLPTRSKFLLLRFHYSSTNVLP
eukprot:EG_transcript_3317